jgi:hypothetical protein
LDFSGPDRWIGKLTKENWGKISIMAGCGERIYVRFTNGLQALIRDDMESTVMSDDYEIRDMESAVMEPVLWGPKFWLTLATRVIRAAQSISRSQTRKLFKFKLIPHLSLIVPLRHPVHKR